MEDIAIDAVDQLLKSSEWQVNLQSFLDSHCVYFLGDDDGMAHQHGHFDVFREFSTMKEAIVASAVADMGCTPEAFAAACEVRMKGGDTQTRRMLDLLLYLDDFEVRRACACRVVVACVGVSAWLPCVSSASQSSCAVE
jgi:hypothetical protein